MTSSPEGLIKLNDAARETQKINPSEVENPLARKALDKWNRLRGTRRFPSRADAAPRELGSLLRNIALVRVIEGGADYRIPHRGRCHHPVADRLLNAGMTDQRTRRNFTRLRRAVSNALRLRLRTPSHTPIAAGYGRDGRQALHSFTKCAYVAARRHDEDRRPHPHVGGLRHGCRKATGLNGLICAAPISANLPPGKYTAETATWRSISKPASN